MKSKGFLLAIAIIAIIIGAIATLMGIIGTLANAGMGMMTSIGSATQDPAAKEMLKHLGKFSSYQTINSVLGLFVGLGYLVSGIMLTKTNQTGKKILIYSSIGGIISAIIGAAIAFLLVGPAMGDLLDTAAKASGEKMPFENMGSAFGTALGSMGAIVSLICGLIFPVFFLIGVNSSSVKAQFIQPDE